MKVEFALAEEVEMRPLTGDPNVSTHEPAPKARMIVRFDGEDAIKLTGAQWTVYPPFARLQEAEWTLANADMALTILERFAKSGALPSRLMISMSEAEMDLMAVLRNRV